MRRILCSVIFITALAFTMTASADSPALLTATDLHSKEVKGVVNLYRVQMEGLEFGKDRDAIDAEILVTLDSVKDLVFAIRLHGDSPPINKVMADTLRDAFLNKTPVTIYYQLTAPDAKNVKIHLVQLNR